MAQKSFSSREEEAKWWIETVLGRSFGDKPLMEVLKSGYVLCELVNAIKPNSAKRFKESTTAFVCRNNIQIFLDAAKKLGVPSQDCFESRDLYDGQKPEAVIQGIFGLSGAARKVDGFNGPFIGVKYAEKNTRNFSQEVLNKSKSSVPMWNKGDPHHKKTNMDGYGIIKTDKSMQKHTGVQGTWEKGSLKTDTSSQHDSYGIVTVQGVQKHTGIQSSWEKGSLKTDTSSQHDSYGIVSVQGADKHSGVQSSWEKGSLKTDTSSQHDSYGIISVQGADKHSGVQSNWEKGSLKTDSASQHDSYGIIQQPDHMKN